MIKAIILAAGRGSRMGDATQEQPKCFTQLAGKRLIDWQKEALWSAGIKGITAVTGYRAEMIAAEVDQCFHNPIWSETNMVYSLCQANSLLEKEICVLSYSDIVYHPSIVKKLMNTEGDFCMTYDSLWKELWQLRMPDPLADAETFKINSNGELIEIGQKPKTYADVQGQYMGLLKITPAGWAEVKGFLKDKGDDKKLDMTSLLNALLQRNYPIHTCEIAGGWCEVDTQEDWLAYEKELQNNPNWSHDWRTK